MEKKLAYLFDKKHYNIYILRHPEVKNYQDNVFNGSIDVDLSDRGYTQAEIIFKHLKSADIDLVYSSPLKRCAIVADMFKTQADVVFDERIKERHFGIFESLSWNEIVSKYPKEADDFLKDPFYYRVKKGESFFDVKTRVLSFIEDNLINIDRNILIIAHGGVNRVFISHFLDMNESAILKISKDYACINHFQTDGEFVLCKLMNGAI